jgi:hypothetical protein
LSDIKAWVAKKSLEQPIFALKNETQEGETGPFGGLMGAGGDELGEGEEG